MTILMRLKMNSVKMMVHGQKQDSLTKLNLPKVDYDHHNLST